MTETLTIEEARRRLLVEFRDNRRVAHEVLFGHRHPLKTPAFHLQLIDAFHGPHPRVIIEAFRDAAKSTVAEEALVIGALYHDFSNAVVVGASFARARERLIAVRNEFEVNTYINQLFGNMQGTTWMDGRIVLTNGVCITAVGAGMSVRGTKYLDARPDFWLIDDLEDEESVKSPEARDAMMHWLYRTFMPAMAKGARGRFLGNRLDQDAVIVRISKDQDWRHYRYPIMGQTMTGTPSSEVPGLPDGHWTATWPEKYSLPEIAKKRLEYERHGLLHDFNCEYMCEAEDPGTRLFSQGQARESPTLTHMWEAVYAAYDPARTVNSTSATTGKAVFSWINNRLVVWEGSAHLWLPDEMVDDMLATDERWSLVELGVEATGLEQFILQPLRHRAAQRRQLLPIRRLIPPQGKDTFIKGLQPFFKSGEVEFVNVSSEARSQLMAFPTGRKDFPNALAYALHMRPGLPIYDGFGRDHASPPLSPLRLPYWLAVNATGAYTTAVLLQVDGGAIRVLADWVREGPPGENLDDIFIAARLESTPQLRVVAPPVPGTGLDTVGLRPCARRLGVAVRNGGRVLPGREAIRALLTQRRKDEPLVTVALAARWTLNGFSSGFAYGIGKRGQVEREPADNAYRVLMEGLESFVAGMHQVGAEEDDGRRTAIGADGREYTTIRPVAR